MKKRYAEAFLGTYRKSISKIHGKGKKRLADLAKSCDPEQRLLSVIDEGDQNAYALIGQAHNAYMKDLLHGKHVGTDIELAIWAILANRSDLNS
jgi:hypothetical protein